MNRRRGASAARQPMLQGLTTRIEPVPLAPVQKGECAQTLPRGRVIMWETYLRNVLAYLRKLVARIRALLLTPKAEW